MIHGKIFTFRPHNKVMILLDGTNHSFNQNPSEFATETRAMFVQLDQTVRCAVLRSSVLQFYNSDVDILNKLH